MSRKMIVCGDCGDAEQQEIGSDEPLPCPRCGSKRHVSVLGNDTLSVTAREFVIGLVEESGRKKPVSELRCGDEPNETGRWMKKRRFMDFKNPSDPRSYQEIVIDQETGQVIRYCVEPLVHHRNHGSAKKRG